MCVSRMQLLKMTSINETTKSVNTLSQISKQPLPLPHFITHEAHPSSVGLSSESVRARKCTF